MQKIIAKIIKIWPIFFLIAIAFFLRIIRLNELFYFTYDESIPAFVARRLILWNHLPLIGGVTPFNFHLGPYFYWFYAIILFFGKLNPLAWGYASAVIAVITTLMIYLVGKSIDSKKLGITAAIFWAFSFLTNIYDRHLWALYWGSLVSLIVIYSLFKIIKGQGKYIYLLGLTIALSIHADPSNLVFLLLSSIIWLVYKIPVRKSAFIAFGIILLSFLPLIVFDLRHNFANPRPVVDFWKQGKNNPGFDLGKFTNNSLIFPRAFSRLIYTFGDDEIAKQYSYCRNYVIEKYQAIPLIFVILSSVILISFIFWIFKNKKNEGWRLASWLIILYFFGIQLYGTIFRADIFEHYITGLFAVFLFIFAKIVGLVPKNLWLLVIGLFIVFNFSKLLNAKNSMGLKVKKEAIEFTMREIGDKPFSLDSLSTCWKYSGYRYLFTVFGREPVKSYVDSNFAYLYGTTPVAQKHPKTVVAFVIHDFLPETEQFYKRYALLKSHEVKTELFGNIEVIIMDNSSGWFDKPKI